jgi:hypothetical protein
VGVGQKNDAGANVSYYTPHHQLLEQVAREERDLLK